MRSPNLLPASSAPAPNTVTRAQLIRDLHELIAALDQRVPRVERAGEASIAHDAAALRARALKRLAELGGADPQD
jgi:hypothetical protein